MLFYCLPPQDSPYAQQAFWLVCGNEELWLVRKIPPARTIFNALLQDQPSNPLVESVQPMLTLRDFTHIPQLDPLVRQIAAEPSGLVVVAGLDPQPNAAETQSSFLPSGRHALFGLLLDEILDSQADKTCTVITQDRKLVRVPRPFRGRVTIDLLKQSDTYAQKIAAAIKHEPGLLGGRRGVARDHTV